MDFLNSETCRNLARTIAGESQARSRYTAYAEQARKEKQEYLARIFEQTAGNEAVHAKEFLELLVKLAGGSQPNIAFDAGYPYQLDNTAKNLQFAAAGEAEEYTKVYPAFAAAARKEGFPDAAALWEAVGPIEGLHHNVFAEAHRQYTAGTLYRREQPVVWRCLNCGYVLRADEPWQTCPVCHKDAGWAMGYVDNRNAPQA